MTREQTYTIEEIETFWGVDRDQWGLLGPLEPGVDDIVKFTHGDGEPGDWQLERYSDEGRVWYVAVEATYGADDIPPRS